jgi:Protein of unknown function (DUF3558)
VSVRTIVFGMAVAAALVAGCSNKESGSPTATPGGSQPTGSTSTSDPGGSGGAPKVQDPLDASKFLGQPCGVLAPDQLQALRLPAQGKPDVDSPTARTTGPGCSWFDRDAGSGVEFGFLTANKNGLSDTYKGKARFKGYFEPTEVDGYPAVFNDLLDYRNNGTCNITIGISDTSEFRVGVQDTKLGVKSCDRAKEAATAMIKTMQKGA